MKNIITKILTNKKIKMLEKENLELYRENKNLIDEISELKAKNLKIRRELNEFRGNIKTK